MRRGPIRVVRLEGDRRAMGLTHGTTFRDEIRDYTNDRIELVCAGAWSGGPIERSSVLDLAEQCVPAHEAYAPGLAEEFRGLAEGAGLSLAEMVVVSGFTDFVDLVHAHGRPHGPDAQEDDCTALLVPDERGRGAGFLAQTWDMHASATEHIVLLDLRPENGPRAYVMTTVGCVGQMGMNEHGMSVGINNLAAADGQVGVTWPHVVREMLECETTAGALSRLDDATLAGGHSFELLDADGSGAVVEAMPTRTHVEPLRTDTLVHTNHCLVGPTLEVQQTKPEVLQSSSDTRYDAATAWAEAPFRTPDDALALMAEPPVCATGVPPYDIESCGAIVMQPRTGDVWTVWGLPSDNPAEHRSLRLDPGDEHVLSESDGLRFVRIRPEHAEGCERVEYTCFPTIATEDLLSADAYRRAAELFPEGGVVVLDGTRVVGVGLGILVDFDFSDPQHRMEDLCGPLMCTNHRPDGDWYYGTDIAVLPGYRRRGIGAELYRLRKKVVDDLGKRGIIAGGALPGYADHKASMSAARYVELVAAGELYDPTLTFQIETGFEARGVLADYVHDEGSDGWASLIVWEADQAEPTPIPVVRNRR